ncbi:MAG: 50S ribosomal protein L32 [Anaerolineae bacterium]|nr:50S ribosomal protein L32 [Anaerolineae bacterium]
MTAQPKRRISKARRDRRRTHHALRLKSLVECPQCKAKKLPHYVCRACGYYRNTQVIEVKS